MVNSNSMTGNSLYSLTTFKFNDNNNNNNNNKSVL